MNSEGIENKRKKLIFRSNHRGTKEMDLIMGGFAAVHVPHFTDTELEEYERILQESDPDLYNWITGKESPPEHLKTVQVFQRFLNFNLH